MGAKSAFSAVDRITRLCFSVWGGARVIWQRNFMNSSWDHILVELS